MFACVWAIAKPVERNAIIGLESANGIRLYYSRIHERGLQRNPPHLELVLYLNLELSFTPARCYKRGADFINGCYL